MLKIMFLYCISILNCFKSSSHEHHSCLHTNPLIRPDFLTSDLCDKEFAKSHKTHPVLILALNLFSYSTTLLIQSLSPAQLLLVPCSFLHPSHTGEVDDKLHIAAVTRGGGGLEQEEGTICALLQGHVESEKRDI